MTMDDDGDLWGPPLVVQDDTFRKQTLRGYELWFDCRTDVLEESFQNERYCEQVSQILTEKKNQAVEIHEHEKDSVSLHNDMVSSGSGDSHDTGSSDSEKTLSAVLPVFDPSSAQSALDEDENTSSISDAQTIHIRDSTNDTEEIEPETRLKPHGTAAIDPLTVEATKDANTSSISVLGQLEEAEEHSFSSLVTDQLFDPLKQGPENKSSSATSSENIRGSTLKPLLLETSEKVREKANATPEDGEVFMDQQESDSLQDIVTAIEPFTIESLLEMCDELDKGRETPCDERSKKSHPEALKAVVKEELIINLLTEAGHESNTALLNSGSVLIKKRQRQSNSSNNKGMNTSFIRNIVQKVHDGNINPVKNSAKLIPDIIRDSSVQTQHADSLLDSIGGNSQRGGHIVSDSVLSLSASDLKEKKLKELRSIAKALKVTHYYKLKKEDLLQRLTMQLDPS